MTREELLKSIIIEKFGSVSAFSEKTGIPASTVRNIFTRGLGGVGVCTALEICKNLGVDITALTNGERQDMTDAGELISYNVIGTVAAGYDGAAVEQFTGEVVDIPISYLPRRNPADFFALRVRGNSMYPKLLDGDVVLVERCTSVDSGTIAIIGYGTEEATVKRVEYKKGEDWLELVPINPEYPPRRISGEELSACHIFGRAVRLIREI